MKIYIAGSLFSEGEIAQRLLEEKRLRERFGHKITIYNPITAPFNQDKSTLPTPVSIYDGDFSEVSSSDILLVDLGCMYDQGVMLEIGLAAGLNECNSEVNDIKIIGVLSDIRLDDANRYGIPSFGMNHMVLGAIQKHGYLAKSFDEALELIGDLI